MRTKFKGETMPAGNFIVLSLAANPPLLSLPWTHISGNQKAACC